MLTSATQLADWAVILPVVLSLMGAALLLLLRARGAWQGGIALLIAAAICGSDLVLFVRVLGSGPVSMTMGRWLPPFGISFTADMLGAAFALVAACVTLVVLAYLQMELPERARRDGVFPLILLLLAGVSGAFLTGDLFNLYVWFEVALAASFGLLIIGGRIVQLDAAIKYGVLNLLATTLFLAALGLLYGLLGTVNMADIIVSAPKADAAPMAAVGALLLLAFAIKAAAFPVNAWLPASYHTPPAAISALMAGLLTKMGAYALIRTLVLLLPASRGFLEPVLAVLAIATLVLAPLGAIAETNLRRALGFLVIGGIGAALAGIAMPLAAGVSGSVVYVLHAMLTMTAFYLVAGLVETLTGQVDTRRMHNVGATSSLISSLFLVLVLAVAGVPPFLGFWPKLLLLDAGLKHAVAASGGSVYSWSSALVVALLLNALLTMIAGTRLWAHIFWRAEPLEGVAIAQRGFTRREKWLGLFPAAALVAVIVVAGIWPNMLIEVGKVAGAGLTEPSSYIAATGIEVRP